MDYSSDSDTFSPKYSKLHSDSSSNSLSDLETASTDASTLFSESIHEFWHPYTKFIMIVGGLGHTGSHTCLELLKAGYNVLIIDNLSNSFRTVDDRIDKLARRNFETTCKQQPLMRFVEVDYRDEIAMRELLVEYIAHQHVEKEAGSASIPTSRVKGVIHFGTYKSVSESIQNPLRYYANNVAGMIDFCSLLNEFNIKTLIFSSSATIYGKIADCGLPLREEYCAHQPESFIDHDGLLKTTLAGCTGLTNPYGRTKWMCEAILSDLAVADPEWTIIALRYFNPVGCDESGLLGEDPRDTPTNLMPVVLQVLTRAVPELQVFGTDYPTLDGTAVRDFIHVTDLARGHIAALAGAATGRVPKGFRAYNLGSGIEQSVYDVVGAVEKASSKKVPLRKVDRRDGDVGYCVAMPKRAEMELNWKTEKSLKDCCTDIFTYLEMQKVSGV